MPSPVPHVFDRLIDACRATRSRVCVGLDPHLELVPPDARARDDIERVRLFLFPILEAIAGVVPAVKPQIAFFEQLGPAGYALYFDVIREAHRRGLFVIGDIKRADIGSTAAAYARAHLGPDDGSAADAVTLNPYLGFDGIEPFLTVGRARGRGVFVLVRTSNASAKEFQDCVDRRSSDAPAAPRERGPDAPVVSRERREDPAFRIQSMGEPLYMKVGRALEKWGTLVGKHGYTDVGAVVGATRPDEGAALRDALPKTFFLVPGFGAQGATAADVARTFTIAGEGALVNSSRAILAAWKEIPDGVARFAECARAAARQATAAIAAALRDRAS